VRGVAHRRKRERPTHLGPGSIRLVRRRDRRVQRTHETRTARRVAGGRSTGRASSARHARGRWPREHAACSRRISDSR
jgi:hypothetical protein